ncbi:hypothetical protein ACFLQX_00710 [Bacteroidota bacterium]
MKSAVISLFILFTLALNSLAQLRTYLGLETGPGCDINYVQDPGNLLSKTNIPGSIAGITLKQEIIPNLSIETGASYHSYYSGINMKDRRPDNAGWKKMNAILVPVRLSYKLQPTEYPVSISPRIGYQFGYIIGDPGPTFFTSLISDPEATTLEYNLVENIPVEGSMHLLEFGLSTEYTFENNWQVSLALSHFSGMKEVSTSDIAVNVSSGLSHTAHYSMDGTRIQTTARLSIPVSNLWENKDLRIRKSIEKSRGSGRSTIRPQRYIYFGGDVGALWRGFRTSNPAVGSRPITAKGLFRYSNLHTGIYVGILGINNLGIDLGAYYQRSSLFFSLMYDHEVDFVTKTRAPMYLDIPLRVRYYYNVYKGRVLIVPSVGISVLTHFAAGNYGAGNDSFSYLTLTGNGNGSVDYSGTRTARIGLMLKGGLGCEYRIPIKFPLYATASLEYNYGLKEIDEIQVSTSISEAPEISTVKYIGSGWNFAVGARVPIILGKDNRKCGAIISSQ